MIVSKIRASNVCEQFYYLRTSYVATSYVANTYHQQNCLKALLGAGMGYIQYLDPGLDWTP